MARRNEKYTPEMREQTAAYILESGKSATKTAKEMGIDVNTVCRWVQDYRKKHNLPSYAEEKGIPFYDFNEENQMLVDEKTHNNYRLGDQVVVKVVRASKEEREIDFQIIRKL